MSFFNQLAVCKPCTGSDPTQDTVKVNPALLAGGKENVEPFSTMPQSKSPIEQEKANRLQEEEEVRKAQEAMMRLAEAKKAEERRRAEEEAMRKRQEEEAARAAIEALRVKQAAEKAAEEKRRLAQEQAAREAAEAAEAARKAEAAEAARLAEEARLRQEEEELRKAQEKTNTWCKANDFADVNTPKKKLLGGFKFPLHTAVKHHNLEMVKALIKCGADKKAQDSKGQTAYSFAMKNNKNDSMAEFLPILAPAADSTVDNN